MPGWLMQLQAWWSELPREWAFLMLLPFAVALAGWLADGAGCGRRGPR